MKTLTPRPPAFFGIILLAAIMVFPFASCDNDPGNATNGNGNNNPEIPAALQDTEWTHTSGDKISFTKDSVTITPSGGQVQTFKLKDVSVVNQINQTTLFFGDDQTKDHIVYQDGKITMVNFNIINTLNRANGWSGGNGNADNENDPNANPAEDFQVISNGRSSWFIEKYKGNVGNVVIPSTINGKSVVGISQWCFDYPSATQIKLTSIVIPSSITHIGGSAFRNQDSLTSITIGTNVFIASDSPLPVPDKLNGSNTVFENNFQYHYVITFNKAAGTYTRTIGADVWTKAN